MKKSKRLRFYALIQKQSQGALSAAEQLELNQLSTLASQHPNASADEDDTGEDKDGEKKKKKEGEDEEEGEGEKVEGEDKDKDKDKDKSKAKTKTTLGSMIGAAIQSAKAGTGTAASLVAANQSIATLTGERDQARAALAPVTGERDQARTDLATAQASLTAVNGQFAVVLGFLGLEAKSLAGKNAEQVAALVGTAVNSAVTEQLGTLGFPAATLPASTEGDKATTSAELHRQFNAITDPQKRAEFYDKNKTALMS